MGKKKSKAKAPKLTKEVLDPALTAVREQIFDALTELRVTSARADWSGGGDSGQVDSVVARDEKQDVEVDLGKSLITVNLIEEESVDSGRVDSNGVTIYIDVKKTVTKKINLEELIGSFAEDLWTHFDQGGWYNDDGGYGSLVIDVAKRDMKFEHYNNYTESNLDAQGII